MLTTDRLDRIASGLEHLATNPDIWLRQAVLNDLAQAFRELAEEGVGPKLLDMSFVTEVLNTGEEAVGSVNIAKEFVITRVVADKPCRIRLYATNQFRVDDSARPVGTDPTGEFGLLLELVLTNAFLDFNTSPAPIGYNGDDPVSSAIYYAIRNDGAPGPINITIYYTELVP